jgi:UDP-glucuronate 4-epimerase
VFNHGNLERDFTYIDDVIEAIYKLIDKIPIANESWDERRDKLSSSFAPYAIYNIGNNSPVQLMRFINVLEDKIGMKAQKIYMDMQPGDVLATYADINDLERKIGFKPRTNIEEGLDKFVNWYKKYYKIEEENF